MEFRFEEKRDEPFLQMTCVALAHIIGGPQPLTSGMIADAGETGLLVPDAPTRTFRISLGKLGMLGPVQAVGGN